MGTKRIPGTFDCYAKAEPDEPMFTLLARDDLAPGLVVLWAALRAHDIERATAAFEQLVRIAPSLDREQPAKVSEAGHCAIEMMAWSKPREFARRCRLYGHVARLRVISDIVPE